MSGEQQGKLADPPRLIGPLSLWPLAGSCLTPPPSPPLEALTTSQELFQEHPHLEVTSSAASGAQKVLQQPSAFALLIRVACLREAVLRSLLCLEVCRNVALARGSVETFIGKEKAVVCIKPVCLQSDKAA